MRKILFIASLFACFFAQGQVGVKVLAPINPNAPTDQYPTHIDTYGQGGLRTVTTVVQRDAITAQRRKEGMLVYVADSVKFYQLNPDLTTWTEFSGTGSGVIEEADPIFVNHISYTITQQKIDLWNQIALLPLYTQTDTMNQIIHDSAVAHDYLFNPLQFTVTPEREVSFIGSYIETDPVFLAHVAHSITQQDIDRWNAQDTSLTKTWVQNTIADSLLKYRYYFDGNTIQGTGAFEDPFHIVFPDSVGGGGGGTGTVRIVETNTATGITGGTITDSGRLAIDTTLLATRLYVASQAADGSETKVTAGTNITITGAGTVATPYVINSTASGSGSVTSVATNTATGIVGGTITTSGTLAIDTNLIRTVAMSDKIRDSLGSIIDTKLSANQPITVTATGDATGTSSSSATAPSLPLTLATVNGNTGTFGSGTQIPVLTVDAKGRITAVTTTGISGASGGTVTSVATNTATGIIGGTITSSGTLALDTNVVRTVAMAGKVRDSLGALITAKADKATTLTINGVAFDLSANRSWTIAGGVTDFNGRTGAITPLVADYSAFYEPVTVRQTHTSGATVTISNATTWLVVNPATPLSALTVTTPATPVDNERVTISFGGTITSGNTVVAFTMAANSGQTVLQPPTATPIDAGETISWKYNISNTTWYRIN